MEKWPLKSLIILFCMCLGISRAQAGSMHFKSALNDKELVLSWGPQLAAPKIHIHKGKAEGYVLTGQDDELSARLPGGHWVRLNKYENNGLIHLVLFEARKNEFGFHAWSIQESEGTKVFTHDLNSLPKLPVEESLASSGGSSFDFKQVMRVPQTDKFFSFSNKNEDYLQCHYLGKLQGYSPDENTCLFYQRMMNLTRYSSLQLDESHCFDQLLSEKFFSASTAQQAKKYAPCFSVVKTRQGCFEKYLRGEGRPSECAPGSEVASEEERELEVNGTKLINSLARQSVKSRDQLFVLEGSRYQTKLRNDLADELVILHCATQFLAESGSSTKARLIQEASSSCLAAYFEGRDQSARWSNYLAKWFVEKKLNYQFAPLLSAAEAESKLSTTYWLSLILGNKHEASELVRQGIFNLPAIQPTQLRAPASLSP